MGTLLWIPKLLELFTLEILARNAKVNFSSVLQFKTVVCFCSAKSQCLYNQTKWVGNSFMEECWEWVGGRGKKVRIEATW